jgi:sugar/nucleoside kinase (ribokinase family)
MNLVAFTPCCIDYYPQINKSFIGGNSLNVASMWKTMEPKENVSIITCLGNDSNAGIILDYLVKKKIDMSRVYQKQGVTASNKIRVDEDGERYGIEGAWNGGVYETFLLSASDWEFVAMQDIVAIPGNNPNYKEMTKRKHAHQLLCVDYLDVFNKVPIYETIEFTDIAFVAAPPEIIDEYKDMAFTRKKLIVVTMGAHGSYAFCNGEAYYQPALKVNKVIDTTGCGDAYQAAFALTYYKTKNIRQSMLAGAEAALIILQAWGGIGNS